MRALLTHFEIKNQAKYGIRGYGFMYDYETLTIERCLKALGYDVYWHGEISPLDVDIAIVHLKYKAKNYKAANLELVEFYESGGIILNHSNDIRKKHSPVLGGHQDFNDIPIVLPGSNLAFDGVLNYANFYEPKKHIPHLTKDKKYDLVYTGLAKPDGARLYNLNKYINARCGSVGDWEIPGLKKISGKVSRSASRKLASQALYDVIVADHWHTWPTIRLIDGFVNGSIIFVDSSYEYGCKFLYELGLEDRIVDCNNDIQQVLSSTPHEVLYNEQYNKFINRRTPKPILKLWNI